MGVFCRKLLLDSNSIFLHKIIVVVHRSVVVGGVEVVDEVVVEVVVEAVKENIIFVVEVVAVVETVDDEVVGSVEVVVVEVVV